MAHEQLSRFVAQMHPVAAAIFEYAAIPARTVPHPFAVAVWCETVVPYVHEIVSVNVALVVAGPNARASRDGAVYPDAGDGYAGAAVVERVAYIAFVPAEKAFASVIDRDAAFAARISDELHQTAELFRIELQTRVVCAAAYREDGEDAPAFHPFGYQEIPESGQGGEGVCIGAGHVIVEDVRLTGEQPEGAERAFVAAFVPPYAVMSFGETVEADGSRMQAGTKQRLQAAFVEQHSVRDDAPRIPPVVKGPSDLFDVAPHQGLSARNDDENPIRNDMWGYRIDCPEKIGGGHVGYGGLAAAVASAVTAREVAAEGSLPHDGTQFVSRDAFVLYTGEYVECEPSAHSQAVLHPLSGIIRCLSSPR